MSVSHRFQEVDCLCYKNSGMRSFLWIPIWWTKAARPHGPGVEPTLRPGPGLPSIVLKGPQCKSQATPPPAPGMWAVLNDTAN